MSIYLIVSPLLVILINHVMCYWKDINKTKKKEISLLGILLNYMLTIALLKGYDVNTTSFQYIYFVGNMALLGKDSISLWKILLTNKITGIVILHSHREINDKGMYKKYIQLILWVNIGSILVFSALDILLFYISFEKVLIPLYYLIGYYGSRNKKKKAQALLLMYTIKGSLFLLIGIFILYQLTGTTNYQILLNVVLDEPLENLLFLLFFISFLIKTPTFPFHIWLPIAHSEGSTGTSVILASIILKFGTYGFIRFVLPFFPNACETFLPLIYTLSILSLIYCSIIALSINDIKVVIAYSSIIHMNVANIGLFSGDALGISAAYTYSVAHGFISGGLFILVGILYSRYHTKSKKYYRGLFLTKPLFVILLFLFNLSNLSFPLSLGYITETMILISSFNVSPFISFFSALACLLLPFVMFMIFQRISFGTISNHFSLILSDLTVKEFHLLIPLLFMNTFFGIYPYFLFDSITFPVLSLTL